MSAGSRSFPRGALRRCRRCCKLLVRAGVGYNNVDLEAAEERGVVVCNVPDYGTEEVADHAIMFLLALARKLVPCHNSVRDGDFTYLHAVPTPRLRGKTFGVVGCGRIGTATALRAKAFGLDVVFYDPNLPEGADKAIGIRRVYALDDLLAQSHFVSLHCYLDEGSHHLVNAETLAKMRPGSILINTARGPVVDQVALVEALDSGHIEGAGLDVVEREPLDDDRLRYHPKAILTPHSAFTAWKGSTNCGARRPTRCAGSCSARPLGTRSGTAGGPAVERQRRGSD